MGRRGGLRINFVSRHRESCAEVPYLLSIYRLQYRPLRSTSVLRVIACQFCSTLGQTVVLCCLGRAKIKKAANVPSPCTAEEVTVAWSIATSQACSLQVAELEPSILHISLLCAVRTTSTQ
jgi:hypothetical protein